MDYAGTHTNQASIPRYPRQGNFSRPGRLKALGILAVLVILITVPLTLFLSRQQQDLRQRAAEVVCRETGTDTILIIDKSGSMNERASSADSSTRLTRAKEAAKMFADIISQKNSTLPDAEKHKIGIVSFANNNNTVVDAELTSDMTLIKQKIDALTASGQTCTECGVKKASLEFASARARPELKNVSILLTDGKANYIDGGTSQATTATAEQKTLAAVQAEFTANKTNFFTIGLGAKTEINESFLDTLATETLATYYHSPSATELNSIYTSIAQIIGKGIIRGYVFQDTSETSASESGKPRLSGWEVKLYKGNSTTEVVASTTTDADGEYMFTNVCDGPYTIRQTLQPTFTQTVPTSPDYYAITMNNAETITERIFGNAIATPTATPTTPPTITPTDILTPTGTQEDETTSLNLNLFLHGIGAAGDNTLPRPAPCQRPQPVASGSATGSSSASLCFSNQNPLHPTRDVTVELLGNNGVVAAELSGTVTYASASGTFKTIMPLPTPWNTGQFVIKVSIPGYLTRRLPGIHTITSGREYRVPDTNLVSSDAVRDNRLSILDYNLILSCYTFGSLPQTCTPDMVLLADVTDDGTVNEFDENLFRRDLVVQYGE